MIYVVIGVIVGVLAFGASRRLALSIGLTFLAAFVAYVTLPTLAVGFYAVPLFLLGTGLVVLAAEAVYRRRGKARWKGPLALVAAGVLFAGVVPFVLSTPIVHAAKYHALIADVGTSDYAGDTAPVDPAHVRIVDRSVAERLAEKRLGENTALGSQVRVGTLSIQQVGERLYWVAPLEHSGFFKWLGNRDGTPGYVMVSATDERDVRLVQQVAGEPLRIRYNDGAFFGSRPARYLYAHGLATTGLADYTFEIDDAGRPYLVVTTYAKRVGYGGEDATGVAVLDVQTGAVARYAVADAPAWIDRIQPEGFVIDQLDDWGRYVHGWWNPSDRDRLMTTPGTSLVYGDDGRSYFYTGLTSVGKDESTVGFVLVDTRTKDVRFYKQTGATETAAMASAQGSVQEKGYAATFPVLYNVSGMPTYFMTLKDDEGLVKAMAFVGVENYQIVGIGETVEGSLRAYRRSVASRGNEIAPAAIAAYARASGRVLRFSADMRGGETYYYLLLEGLEDRAFVGSVGVSVELPLTRAGDVVEIRYEDGGNAVVDIMGFDNIGLAFQKTEDQLEVEARGDDVRRAGRADRLAPLLDSTSVPDR
jgi:hypothetical protein